MIAALRILTALLCLATAGALQAAGPANGAAWAALTPAQKQVLAPLQRDWTSIDEQRRAKWIELASRFPSLPAGERTRLQERMAEWARMTPAERGRARLQFQDARQLPPSERQDRWQAYQALPEGERRALAQRAKPATKAASGSMPAPVPAPAANTGKRNMVQTNAAPSRRTATPTGQQAKPGATTTPLTARAQPPAHHQAGLPKIAATPGFVNPSTLLPQRGPQGAAVRSAATSSEPAKQP